MQHPLDIQPGLGPFITLFAGVVAGVLTEWSLVAKVIRIRVHKTLQNDLCIRGQRQPGEIALKYLHGGTLERAHDLVLRGLGGDQRGPGQEAQGTAPDPVSYTHLRAHETVLDLVCRLLLEKKKKKHITNT